MSTKFIRHRLPTVLRRAMHEPEEALPNVPGIRDPRVVDTDLGEAPQEVRLDTVQRADRWIIHERQHLAFRNDTRGSPRRARFFGMANA
ncbi:MAG: hypothetical protein AB7G37_17370 [Solirubrobacteraceae bacterium]